MSTGIAIAASAMRPKDRRREEALDARMILFVQAALWAAMFTVFFVSPVLQMNDSQYSMLTAESIIHNHTPDLSGYVIKNYDRDLPFNSIAGKHPYQLVRTNGRLL